MIAIHEGFMQLAINEAQAAISNGDAPVGAVIAQNGVIVAKCYNKKTSHKSGIAHAELLVLNDAIPKIGRKPINAILYTTLEPCGMCMGAIIFSGISEIVVGSDDKIGGGIDLYENHSNYSNLMPKITRNILKSECDELLKHPSMKNKSDYLKNS